MERRISSVLFALTPGISLLMPAGQAALGVTYPDPGHTVKASENDDDGHTINGSSDTGQVFDVGDTLHIESYVSPTGYVQATSHPVMYLEAHMDWDLNLATSEGCLSDHTGGWLTSNNYSSE